MAPFHHKRSLLLAAAVTVFGVHQQLPIVDAFAVSPVVLPTHQQLSPLMVLSYSNDGNDLSVIHEKREAQKREWVERAVEYYSKVMREERRRRTGELKTDAEESRSHNLVMAKKHYFALRKIKDGKLQHAEHIYRRIIGELLDYENEDECDHSKLAVTTLLLALLLQRTGDVKKTRSVFLHFFRIVALSQEEDPEDHHCACSAKVVQAWALFEMKQGNRFKSLELAEKAIKFDPSIRGVLNWKQFRDTQERRNRLRP